MDEILTFDRTDDVSKLEGCNTRGVEYRWEVREVWVRALDEARALPWPLPMT